MNTHACLTFSPLAVRASALPWSALPLHSAAFRYDGNYHYSRDGSARRTDRHGLDLALDAGAQHFRIHHSYLVPGGMAAARTPVAALIAPLVAPTAPIVGFVLTFHFASHWGHGTRAGWLRLPVGVGAPRAETVDRLDLPELGFAFV